MEKGRRKEGISYPKEEEEKGESEVSTYYVRSNKAFMCRSCLECAWGEITRKEIWEGGGWVS